mgnify:CR=1 FL=1
MPVTSADVARAAGVSRATVSYVLNDTPGSSISAATKEHVRATAARLGYAPSAAARALRRGRSDLVVCVLPDWTTGPVVDTLLDLLGDTLAARGLFLLVHHHRPTRPVTDLWKAVTPRAVVGLTEFPAADLRALAQAGIDVVGADAEHARLDAELQRDIARLQVGHLVDTGRRRVAVATTTDPRLTTFAEQRTAGVVDACADRGLPVPDVVPLPADRPATDAVRAWAAADVDAVACYNDEVAFAVLAGATSAGVAVPDDLAVIGVDDFPAAGLVTPGLTTIAQPVEAHARHLADSVVAALDGAPGPAWPADPCRVVVRDTT